jgi:hypothetical protein
MGPSKIPSNTPTGRELDAGRLHVPPVDEYIQSATVGATGRVWALPFKALSVEYSSIPIFVGTSEMNTAANTRDFLARHAPAELANLREELQKCIRTPHGEWLNATHRMLINPESCAHLVCPVNHTPRPSEDPPPTRISMPTITPDHWYYRRHFNPGSYTAPTHYPEQASVTEVAQDIQSLTHYMTAYDTLAREPSGGHLFLATLGAAYRAPYYSCMQLCGELRVPGHFLAMIHHGIGMHMLIGHAFTSMHPRNPSPAQESLRHVTDTIYERIVTYYREDFPGTRDIPRE